MDSERQVLPAEHDAITFSDDDSTMGDIEVVEMILVPMDCYNYLYRHGRIYPPQYEDYPWPIDSVELERQEELFHLLIQLYGARLQHAPIVEPARVLDIGTGIGSWAIEFADQNPYSEVSGIDLVPIQTQWVPPNCQFFVDDFTAYDWRSPFCGIDFIHIGWWNGNGNAPEKFLREIYRSCAFGGWVEIAGFSIEVSPRYKDTVFGRFYAGLCEAYDQTNRSFEMPPSCSQLLEMQGFVNITEHSYDIPLESQHTDGLYYKIVENWIAGLEAYALEVLAGTTEVTGLEILLLCADARKEFRENKPHGFLKRRVIFGQRPGAFAH